MKTAVLLSGGVDSSVALRLLLAEGTNDITAFYLKIWLEDDLLYLGTCPWQEDLEYARQVCDQAGVPLEVVSLQREYYERVVRYAIAELKGGRTPSPDIFCNQRIKFGLFPEKIDAGFEKIASGHYATITKTKDGYLLCRSPDRIKDQTYFLSQQSQDQIGRSLFPIGDKTKKQVRALAAEMQLPTKDRKDSQGICFLGKIRYPDFVRHYLGENTGEIVERETGAVLGEHSGYWFYTIGQRQGLGLGNGPWYVCDKNVEQNRIFVTHGDNRVLTERSEFCVTNLNWINGAPMETKLRAKLRHGPELIGCTITWSNDNTLGVKLDSTDPGIAPGQFCVFYHKNVCLGGGVILR